MDSAPSVGSVLALPEVVVVRRGSSERAVRWFRPRIWIQHQLSGVFALETP